MLDIAVLGFNINLIRSQSSTIIVPDDYPTIQAAVDAAEAGDIIFVKSGTYAGNITVNKTVTIIGEDEENTIVTAPETDGIIIEADNVEISKLTVRSYHFGIWIKSSGCLIRENYLIYNDYEGVFIDGRNRNITRNIVTKNQVLSNRDCGILVWGSVDNEIAYNMIRNSTFGVYLYSPEGKPNRNCIHHNKIIDNMDCGIILCFFAQDCMITYNDIIGNGWRFDIWTSGIAMAYHSDSNQIVANNLTSNRIGVSSHYDSNNNAIYHNSFTNNSMQALNEEFHQSVNVWDNGYPSGGNYWSDYTGSDGNDDGIGDQPYVIDQSNTDRYPLMKPYVPRPCDLNADGRIDIRDISIAAKAFGSYIGCPRWNPIADLNHDNIIDLRDLAAIARNYGAI
jgi:parallel beta-helix repeat protein